MTQNNQVHKRSTCRNKRPLLILIVFFVLFSCMPTAATGSAYLSAEQQSSLSTPHDAIVYALAPDGLLPFIYEGVSPFTWLEMDTSGCVIGQLYVLDKASGIISSVGAENVTELATTKDSLFYADTTQTIFRTNYSGAAATALYQATLGEIRDLSAFGTLLYFIEGDNRVVLLDTTTGQSTAYVIESVVSSVYMFDYDKFIWYDSEDAATYYNTTTGVHTVIENPYQVNVLVNSYTEPESPSEDTLSILAITDYNNANYNDVDFPLDEYPATLGTEQTLPSVVQSRFTTRYAGAGECDGFAKYAHDRFFHLDDTSRTVPSWQSGSSVTADHHGALPSEITNSSYNPFTDSTLPVIDTETKAKGFFQNLGKGAFIRYVKMSDTTPYNGNHSIVFAGLASDGAGIYVYEANQDGNNGVGYQYYTFAAIAKYYDRVLYYVNHSFSSTGESTDDSTYHHIPCVNCDGYLVQPHIKQLSTTSQTHTYTCTDCDWSSSGMHLFSNGVCRICNRLEGDVPVINRVLLIDTK